jgi:hypothetical protein
MISNYTYRPRFYFTITFFVTFVFWFAGAYVSFREDLSGLYMLFMLPGLMAPFLLSLWMIYSSKNLQLKKDFFNRVTKLRLIDPKTLPVFFLIMPLAVLVSIILSLALGESISQIQFSEGFSFSFGLIPALLILVLAASFEELGWRGYAFDSLQSRYNFLTASILFSILWSFWHFPLIFVKNSYQYEIFHENIWFAVNFFVSIIPMGIIISWICSKNRKSVIAAILFHFIINISQEILDITQTTKCIETVVLIFIALVIIAKEQELFLSIKPTALVAASEC